MKHRDLLRVPVCAALAFSAGFCGAGCLATAFDLPLSWQILALVCGIAAVLVCACLAFRYGYLVVMTVAVLGLEYLSHTELVAQVQQLLHSITSLYHRAYGIPMPGIAENLGLEDLTLALLLPALLGTLVAGISLSRKHSAGAVLVQVLLLAPCLVVTDSQPDMVFVFWLLVGVMLILLSHSARRQEQCRDAQLVALLLVPVLLTNYLVMTVYPRQDFQPPNADALMDRLESWMEWLPEQGDGPEGSVVSTQPPDYSANVDLTAIGPKSQSDYVQMYVHSTEDGFLYLRGRSYAVYDGKGWATLPGQEELFIQDKTFLRMGGKQPYEVRITPLGLLKQQYVGYYNMNPIPLTDGMLPGSGQIGSYTWQVHELNSNWKNLWNRTYGQSIKLQDLSSQCAGMEQYLQLPHDPTQRAQRIVRNQLGLGGDMDVIQAVESIAQWVRLSADYDLNTPAMDADATDFAMWFLMESDTGYCVHYATAAVVLLRAAGIPARYVEGYAVSVKANLDAPVRQRHAHAWAEYYLPNVGWMILEATPNDFRLEPERPTAPPTTTKPTEPTPPPTTTMPTEPTKPTAPPTTVPPTTTKPTKPTMPPITTAPTQPPSSGNAGIGQGGSDAPGPGRDFTWLWRFGRWLLWLALAAVTMLSQQRLRLRWRQRWLRSGSANERAAKAWRYTRYLARLRRQQPPEALQELALKARFSQHTLTEEELAQFEAYFRRSKAHLQRSAWPLRLVYRWILALW